MSPKTAKQTKKGTGRKRLKLSKATIRDLRPGQPGLIKGGRWGACTEGGTSCTC